MPKLRIRKGDTVMVIAGKYKGKKGKVLEVDPEGNRVTIDGVNMVKRHQRPTRQVMQGGIIDKPAPVHRSNVMLICDKCKVPVRVGARKLENGRTVRTCAKCGEDLDK